MGRVFLFCFNGYGTEFGLMLEKTPLLRVSTLNNGSAIKAECPLCLHLFGYKVGSGGDK
jgi:hypothetical protein